MVARNVTVLLVEDDPDLRDVVAHVLEEAGFKVLVASTGEDALTMLQARPGEVDWLFTDIRLPGVIDGWRVADEFRFSHPLRPVVFTSGKVSEKPRTMCDSLFLRKPYRVSEVVRAFELLNEGWAVCGDEVEALGRVRTRDFGPRLSWIRPVGSQSQGGD